MIRLLINDEELDKEINILIISKIKHILRNDEKINELIEECFEKEIKKKVELISLCFDRANFESRINKQVDHIVGGIEKKIFAEVKKTKSYRKLIDDLNTSRIKEMFNPDDK